MFARMMWAAGILALLWGVAEAQDGLRSAALPEPALRSPVADERDLFRVPPDFYNRRPDSDGSRLFFPLLLPTFATTPYWYAPQYPRIAGPPRLDARADAGRNRQREAISEPPALPGAPPTPMLPGKPKTFYVIPGCYAGDRPPKLEWLPAGCDSSKMRVIPPTGP